MWKVGIIGAGYWSEKHVIAWQSIETVQINGFCDKNAELLKEKGELFHIPSENLYLDIINMMENADIDVIDIVTPPETHLELVKLAAKAGKHIMCQKPFANTLEEAEEMVKIANEAGVRLMVTENWRWLEPFQIMKSMLAENIAGIVQTVRYIHTDWYSPRFSPEKTCLSHSFAICQSCYFLRWVYIGLIRGDFCLGNQNASMQKRNKLVRL